MKTTIGTLFLGLCISLIACKEDVKTDIDSMTEMAGDTVIHQVSQEVIDRSNDQKVRQSIMTKIMVTAETSSLASNLVSANMSNMLSTEVGPYTIFAPSNSAFERMPATVLKQLANPNNRSMLANTLKNHIIAENVSSADMVQALRDTDTLRYTTLSGGELKITKSGETLWVIDATGRKAQIGKSDISGNNGILHLIDSVLGLD